MLTSEFQAPITSQADGRKLVRGQQANGHVSSGVYLYIKLTCVTTRSSLFAYVSTEMCKALQVLYKTHNAITKEEMDSFLGLPSYWVGAWHQVLIRSWSFPGWWGLFSSLLGRAPTPSPPRPRKQLPPDTSLSHCILTPQREFPRLTSPGVVKFHSTHPCNAHMCAWA